MKTLYTASALATGDGRNGHVRTLDGHLDAPVRVAKEMGGEGNATNPEQLFAAGYAACFHSALKFVARTVEADTTDSEVVAHVSIGRLPNQGFGLSARLEIRLPRVDHDVAEALIQKAHKVCPYSNATRGNMEVTLSLSEGSSSTS